MHQKILHTLLYIYIATLFSACSNPYLPFTETDAKLRTAKLFPEIQDTADIGLIYASQDMEHHWFVTYNKVDAIPKVCFFQSDAEDGQHLGAHHISLDHKSKAIIEHVDFKNVTNDDDYELLIELHYDYDFSYQARELLIYQNPFSTDTLKPPREIFSFFHEQIRQRIIGFDDEYGNPHQIKVVENNADIEFFEDFILIKGTINGFPNHLSEYKWDPTATGAGGQKGKFILEIDEELHEAEDEEQSGGIVHKVKGSKMLMKVNSHEEGCHSFVLEDVQGHVIDVGEEVHDALLCSEVTSLSEGGRYLIYTNKVEDNVKLLDFKTLKKTVLLDRIGAYEAISDVAWNFRGSRRQFAFIVVNPEEFIDNTCIFVYTLNKNGRLTEKRYDRPVFYPCETRENCVPQKDYTFWFNQKGNLVYKIGENRESRLDL